MAAARALEIVDWGRVPYGEALERQQAAVADRREGRAPDRLVLVEHPPVVTLGRGAKPENLLESPEALRARGIEVHEIARGGDVTWHAPGQLVGYPIVDLDARGDRDVHAHLRSIERALADALASLGIGSRRIDGYTGVFVAAEPGDPGPARKIASIGVGVRRWVTYHGFALNVDLDLEGFACMVPCGLRDVTMTSIARERPAAATPHLFSRAREAVCQAFNAQFG
jgi:lipoate-protein ligase B